MECLINEMAHTKMAPRCQQHRLGLYLVCAKGHGVNEYPLQDSNKLIFNIEKSRIVGRSEDEKFNRIPRNCGSARTDSDLPSLRMTWAGKQAIT